MAKKKECVYCSKDSQELDLIDGVMGYVSDISVEVCYDEDCEGSILKIDYSYLSHAVRISYCPMCGRKL